MISPFCVKILMLPEKLCSGIVYSFKCNSCNAIYYGKTKCHFYVRAAEHRFYFRSLADLSLQHKL